MVRLLFISSCVPGKVLAVRYYFHIRMGQRVIRDLEGSEYPDASLAREEAYAAARELIGLRLLSGDLVDWNSLVEIEQEDGQSVGSVGFLEAIGVSSR
jgi:hypothetical protein